MNNIMSIALLAGARPNYMKVFPVLKELERRADRWRATLIHTGQHYDPLMNDVFFEDFGARKPDHFLGVGSGPHGAQTARVMIALEELFQRERPDALLVVGDVNSTMAGALVASKMGIYTAHLEAGLRSGDRTMPEEINRIVTDAVSDLLLTPGEEGDANLKREGVPAEKIVCVGNIMIDSLVSVLEKARNRDIARRLGTEGRPFCLVTLHRPSNVDDPRRLGLIVGQLSRFAERMPVVFPVHPRTRKTLESAGLPVQRLMLLEPLGYLDFLALQTRAAVVITDSGGIQEETSFLGTPCLTVRPNTERPVTIALGTNRLVDPERTDLAGEAEAAIARWKGNPPPRIPLWDGNTAKRVVDALETRI